MSEPVLTSEVKGSGLRQWGADWFFKRDGNKRSINATALKYAGCAGVLLFAAIQFADTDSIPASAESRSESFGTPNLSSGSTHQEFPMAEIQSLGTPSKKVGSNPKATKLAGPQLIARPRNLAAIPPGSLVRASLVSGASNGAVKAKLEEGLTVNGDLILESGATLLGQGASTEERLMVSFSQVIFRDGSFGTIQAQACDASDQIVGLKGSKIGTKALNIAGSIGLGFLGGLAEGLQDTQGQQGVSVRPPTMRNALLNATGTTALQQSQNLMSDLKEAKPVIEVPAGTPVLVLFGGGQ